MRLPRVRFSVRSMMVAVAVSAAAFAAFAAWMEVAPDERRQHLGTEMTWVRSPVGEFFVKHDLERYTVNSLLKVSDLGAPDGEGHYYMHRWWLGRGGELGTDRTFRTGTGTHSAGGQHYLTAAELAQVQQIISKLPPTNATSSQGDVLLVASPSEGSWVTKVYDKAALPPEVRDLVRVLQQRIR
jgi:hypothetical protein